MARPKKATPLTREIMERYLAVLGDGSPPFIAIASDRCGISRNKIRYWLEAGENLDTIHNDLYEEFATRIRKIRGDWIAEALNKIRTTSKNDAEAARQTNWIIQKLDADEFADVKKTTNTKPVIQSLVKPKDDPAVQAAVQDLAQAEPDSPGPLN